MSSAAQVLANQANAQHSTGPTTEEGKARVAASTRAEYKPQTNEEERLVHSIIQHYWLMQRALTMQDGLVCEDNLNEAGQKRLSLLMRYQTTNERSYYKAMKELKANRKQQIGFESQEAKTRLTNAKAEAQEIETEVHKTVEAALPGNIRIKFSDIQDACAAVIRSLAEETMENKAQ